MKQRKYGPQRERRSEAKRRLRRMTWTIPNVSQKPWPNGDQSGSTIKLRLPLLVVLQSLMREARRNSKSSLIRLFTSPSQTTPHVALCGRHLSTSLVVSSKMTSHCQRWRISAPATQLEVLKRPVRTFLLNSVWKRWSRDPSHYQSLLDHFLCAHQQWTISMTNTASSLMIWLAIRNVVMKSKPH